MERSMRMLFQLFFLLLGFLFLFQVDCSLNFSSSFHHSLPSCLPQQSFTLLQFKNTIHPFEYRGYVSQINSWNESIDCCLWEGVSCHKLTGHVIGINLSYSSLHGPLFGNSSLFLPQSLQWLDLSSNDLDGPLLENSSIFRHLHGLQQLNLSHNSFDGSISSRLFNRLVSLTHLDLSYCEFSGLVPYEISLLSNLVSLDLSYSYDALSFDSQGFDLLARNLTKLTNLVLDSVDMSGVQLTSFLNLTSSLEHLSLKNCNLRGEFPSQVFGLPYLRYIELEGNENVTGYLPRTNLSVALEWLSLVDCRFRGSIPASFGNLTQIMFLNFYNNFFGGQIPDVFENLNKLTTITFSNCNFSGQLPSSLFNLTQLTNLDLSNNRLEGTLPYHVHRLQFLGELSLSNNLISGRVPFWLFTLPSLPSLDLSNNKLNGSIDCFHKPNSSLSEINLSFNNIQGPIPDFFFELARLTTLNLSSNNFGDVVKSSKIAKLKNLSELDLSNNSLLSLGTDGSHFDHPISLKRLSFSSSNITQFPNFLQYSNLEFLNLSHNKISGGIKKWEAKGWEKLRTLDLSHNFLTFLEDIPYGNDSQLFFSFSKNKLSGNIPNSICSCRYLWALDLSENNLTGTIPSCLGNISDVEFINLGMNNLHGEIPDSFTDNSLRYLLLNDNQLEGLIPKSLANCSSLKILNLRNNSLVDVFPSWLASLSNLEVLILSFNRLHGSLPNSMATFDFSTLQIIDVSHNELTGHLPKKFFQNLRAMKNGSDETCNELTGHPPKKLLQNLRAMKYGSVEISWFHDFPITSGTFDRNSTVITGGEGNYQIYVIVTSKKMKMKLVKILTNFYFMDFSNNLFSGQIPEELGDLILLQALNFSHNNLSGSIPLSLGKLKALESLDFSSNKFSGRIPSQLTNLTFLEVLDLSGNDLVGPIPTGRQFDTFDNDSYRGNLGLCGLPLSKQCGDKEGPNPPSPLHVKREGSTIEIPFIWKVAMMGYGCGVVLGVSMGYIVFTTGRPWWFVRKVERDWQTRVTNWIRRNKGRRN